MDNFIEQLYYGNIKPQDRCCAKDSEAHRIEHNVSTLEEAVRSHLSESDRHLLDEFSKAQLELLSISNLDAFVSGFRLGARMTVDTFYSDDAPFQPIEE